MKSHSKQNLAIDSTGLQVYGEGEWKVRTHGTDGKRRIWRKLHLGVDVVTHEIIATELTLSNISDGEVLLNLLKQTRRTILEISGDGAYDTRQCYKAIRIKKATPLVPPRLGAVFWENGHPRIYPLVFSSFMVQISSGKHDLGTIFRNGDASRQKATGRNTKLKKL